ncbi:MAG: phosphatidylserine decarboxylase family protein [Verrucomicrobiales bacterium]|nr:phosphatidylserine decarboxylase family protein [Verrucomicrobiales bacterium]MCP5526199.1 phosphatidylserine decarboxylase family protein [Verrucomicrobiales bacterium]
MKHAGKATRAGLRLIYLSLVWVLGLVFAGILARLLGGFLVGAVGILMGVWFLFGLFTIYFFRDPRPRPPATVGVLLAPAHGKVDAIDEIDEPSFLGGRCRRISTFLSVFDVHVQYAPVAGRVVLCRHTRGQFVNALRADSARFNENVLVGIQSDEREGERIGVRLIAGLIARRIIPWTAEGEIVARGERISLIQFGSRVDLYLPLDYEVTVREGDRVRGGETVMARRAR